MDTLWVISIVVIFLSPGLAAIGLHSMLELAGRKAPRKGEPVNYDWSPGRWFFVAKRLVEWPWMLVWPTVGSVVSLIVVQEPIGIASGAASGLVVWFFFAVWWAFFSGAYASLRSGVRMRFVYGRWRPARRTYRRRKRR